MTETPRRLTLRIALVAGFGLTLGLWLLAGYMVTRQVVEADRRGAALNARYVRAQELLSSVRAQVLLASVAVRDAMLEQDPRPVEAYRREVENAYQSIDALLARYDPVMDPGAEGARVARLRDEIRLFKAMSLAALATDGQLKAADAGLLLKRVEPRKESVLAVSEEIQAINRTVYVDQQRETARVQASLQRQVLTVLGLALVVSFLIAVVALRYGERLERRLVAQRQREEEIAGDLQRLSARLVRVQEEEQRRIARELHDEAGQVLSAVTLELTAADQLHPAPEVRERIRAARALTDGALRSVRDLSQLLHPSVLEDLGLSLALGSFLTKFSTRTGIAVTFRDATMDGRLDPDTERAVYRIAQEALTNVSRHASAETVEVSLHREPGWLQLMIEDDGAGFDEAVAQRPGQRDGLGLLSMRERAAQLGGTFHIDSQVGHGTRLDVRVPVGAAEAMPEAPPLERREVRYA